MGPHNRRHRPGRIHRSRPSLRERRCEPTPCGRPRLEQVYRVTTYSTDLKATHDHVVRNYRRWMPGHQPTWTEVGVKELGLDTMHFEIEVEALDPEGAAVAAAAAKVEGKA